MRIGFVRGTFLLAGIFFLLYNLSAFPALVSTAKKQRVLKLPSQAKAQQAGRVRSAIANVPISGDASVADEAVASTAGDIPAAGDTISALAAAKADDAAQMAPQDAPSTGGRFFLPTSRSPLDEAGIAARLSVKRPPAVAGGFSFGRSSCVPGDFRENARRADHGMTVRTRPLNEIASQAPASWPPPGCQPAALCAALPSIAIRRQLILVVAGRDDTSDLAQFATSAKAASVADNVRWAWRWPHRQTPRLPALARLAART